MSNDEPIPGLRDFMAVSALSCISSDTFRHNHDPEGIAQYCYDIANAMLKERDKNNGSSNPVPESHSV
jgi:hypothetical protein